MESAASLNHFRLRMKTMNSLSFGAQYRFNYIQGMTTPLM